MSNVLEDLGKRITVIRGDESRADFGASLNPKVTADAVGKWERGETNIPYTVLCDIARVKGISVSDLVSKEIPVSQPQQVSEEKIRLACVAIIIGIGPSQLLTAKRLLEGLATRTASKKAKRSPA